MDLDIGLCNRARLSNSGSFLPICVDDSIFPQAVVVEEKPFVKASPKKKKKNKKRKVPQPDVLPEVAETDFIDASMSTSQSNAVEDLANPVDECVPPSDGEDLQVSKNP